MPRMVDRFDRDELCRAIDALTITVGHTTAAIPDALTNVQLRLVISDACGIDGNIHGFHRDDLVGIADALDAETKEQETAAEIRATIARYCDVECEPGSSTTPFRKVELQSIAVTLARKGMMAECAPDASRGVPKGIIGKLTGGADA